MAQRIPDPFNWDGHETETLLACDGTKELVAVMIVRVEEKPEAFYRVKEAGQLNEDFENWLEAVDYYNCIEKKKNPEEKNTGIAKVEITDEDWKTAIAQGKQPIPAGAKVKITGTLQNLYGDFLIVEYNETRYTVDPRKIKMQE
jgi:ribosomal protein L11 methylase PrmA